MGILGTIAVIIIIILILAIIFMPSLAMIFGLNWASKNSFPNKNRWLRWCGVMVVLLITPQILNTIIEHDVKKVVAQSHGEPPRNSSARILAVQKYYRDYSVEDCRADCIALLLSEKIDQYLIAQYPRKHANAKVTAYRFEENSDCPSIETFPKRRLSAKLENTVRLLSLSGKCLTARDATLDIADLLITYDKVPSPSWLTPNVRGHQISISQKGQKSEKWEEVYRDIGLRYEQVYPILLPTFPLVKNRPQIDVMRRTMYRTHNSQVTCKVDWFSDHGPCYRQIRLKPVSDILGVSVSEHNLEKSGIIGTKADRTDMLSNLVQSIILEDRIPSPNEWALINRFISSEYDDSQAFAELAINVASHKKFPFPQLAFGMRKFSNQQKSQLTNAVINRILNDIPGPEIGKSTEKHQWNNLYRIVKDLPKEILEPYFDDLVGAVLLRSNKKQNVEFFEKFGPRSRQPILDILKSDKKRLKSLSSVMCKMGSDLRGIEIPLMKMAENNQISLRGNYGKVVYFLMDLGVDENQLLNTVDQSSPQADNHRNSIIRAVRKYKTGKKFC